MIGSNSTIPPVKGTSNLARPRFAPGMLLQHEDLELMTDYARDLHRLMFRSLFGCGVVCGLVVGWKRYCGQDILTIGAGLGLDCGGDPIYVPSEQSVVIDVNCATNPSAKLWVVLCATTKCCAPRPSMCPGDDDEMVSACTRERLGFEIRVLTAAPKCACSCIIDKDDKKDDKKKETLEEAPAGFTEDAVIVTPGAATTPATASPCACVDPTNPCYADHYNGICGCNCDDCAEGGCCDCILLARVDKGTKLVEGVLPWYPDHSVRRFIRPVLMRDPQPAKDVKETAAAKASEKSAKSKSGKK